MPNKTKAFVKGALVLYLVVAVGIDHFMLGISWAHALMDPLTIGFAILAGLLSSWIARK